MSEAFGFFKAWLKSPLRVAAIAPSGRALASLITSEISRGTGPVIELGPGTGVFTRALIARGVRQEDLALIEFGSDFAAALNLQYPRARTLWMDAARLRKVDLFDGRPAGATVSGLPVLSMPPRKVIAILTGAFRKMRPEGAFYQFTYGPHCPISTRLLDHLGLEAERIGGTLANLPPAAVYRIRRRHSFPSRSVRFSPRTRGLGEQTMLEATIVRSRSSDPNGTLTASSMPTRRSAEEWASFSRVPVWRTNAPWSFMAKRMTSEESREMVLDDHWLPRRQGTFMTKWTTRNIPPQSGRSAVVTGTGGLGYEDALALARTGADVLIAGRNPKKGAEAVAAIKAVVPGARVRFGSLDLANLASIALFAERLAREQDSIDLLINNAGEMTPPQRRETSDGFELQFGTNYLGHFALTAHLWPLLKRGRRPRVITLGSIAARNGAINFEDLQARHDYRPMPVYSQSKLACVMFALELSRRSRAAGWGVESLATHPGVSRTDLLSNGAGQWSAAGMARRFLPFLFQPAWQGALPTLYAATDPAARDGFYYGPDGMGGTRGYPTEETPPKQALDAAAAARLWNTSLELIDVTF